MGPEPGPFLSGFAGWLDAGPVSAQASRRHLGAAKELLAWSALNRHEDLVVAAREFAEYGTPQQASSMRLVLDYLAQEPAATGR